MEKTLKDRTTTALIWSFIDKFGQQIVYFGTGIVLGRNLTSVEYGILGSLIIFIAVSTILVGSGYSRAFLNRKEIKKEDFNAFFYYSTGLGILLYLILFISAPLIGSFFDNHDLILYSRVIFLSVIFTSFMIVPSTVMTSQMNLSGIAKANIFSLIPTSAITIYLAVSNYGVWALIVQNVSFAFFKAIFYNYFSGWRPGIKSNFKVLKEMSSFSSKFLLTNIITALSNYVYNIIIGKVYNLGQLGFFQNANNYKEIPTTIISQTFKSVSMPILSGINDDEERMKRVMSKMIQTIAFIGMPVMLGMILIAKPFYIVIITEYWLPSVPIFQILCVAGMFTIFNSVIEESILSKGKSGALLKLEILKKIILVAVILVTINMGIKALAIGMAFSWMCSLILTIIIAKKHIGYSLTDFFKDCIGYFLIAFVLCVMAYFLNRGIENNYLSVIFSVSFVAVLYLILCKVFNLKVANEAYSLIVEKYKKLKR